MRIEYPAIGGVVLLLSACALENPCPEGSERRASQCLPVLASSDSEAQTSDADTEMSDGSNWEPPDPNLDAGAEEDDAGAEEEDSGEDGGDEMDATTPAPDATEDADTDTTVVLQECPDEARNVWRRFQMSESAVPAIAGCLQADLDCHSGDCDVSKCLKDRAGVVGCDRCVAAEVACAAQSCAVPCSTTTDDDACRACACANGCFDAPAGCGFGNLDACADCVGAGCSARFASTTETITIPIAFHLLHDRVDPGAGIPAYPVDAGEIETILDIDARLAQANALLDAARPDARRLRVIRTAVAYAPAPAPNVCPDPVASTDAKRFYSMLNVVLTGARPSCPAVATSAYAARASGATLLRSLGNLLGIPPAEQAGEPWQITSGQFVRMHNYARWRLGAADAVPEAERQTSAGFVHGPADPIWDKLTNRDWSLANATVFDATSAGPFRSLPMVENFVVGATRATRRVLGVRVSARFDGVPSENLQVVVNAPRRTTTPIPRRAILVGNGTLVAEDAFDVESDRTWDRLRLRYAPGTWQVSIGDTAALVLHDVRLEIVLGDRTFAAYDRHGRGVTDIMVYRPATSELLTAMNPGDGSLAFGAAFAEPVPPLPDPKAKVFTGDVDGDGHVDLLARRGPTIWIAFGKRGFSGWRSGSIAGTDHPASTDEVLMGDFDRDGFGDLMRRRSDLISDRSLWTFYRGVGDGTFEAARTPYFPDEPYPAEISWTIADPARSGPTGLAVRALQQAYVVIHHNDSPWTTGGGTALVFFYGFQPVIDGGYTTTFSPSEQLVVLDANQDGNDDLVVRRRGSGEWFAYLNQGNETFTAMQRLTIGGQSSAFADTDTVLGSAP